MYKKVILAVESGGTKTISAITNEEGKILGVGISGPSNHYAVSFEKAKENFLYSIKKAIKMTQMKEITFDVGCFGMAALDTKQDYDLISNLIDSLNIVRKPIIVSDAIIAYYAVTLGKPGIVVIAGTGSIAYGRNNKGEEAIAGGREWLISDEGSAFDIARKGLIATVKAYDGRGMNTILLELFKKYFKVSLFEDFIQKVYEDAGKYRIASLSPIVSLAAKKGDVVARNILKEAGEDLGLAAISVAKKLGMINEKIIIGCMGGVFKSGRIIYDSFKRKVKTNIPKALFKKPIYNSIIGAIFLGLKESNICLSKELVRKVKLGLKSYNI